MTFNNNEEYILPFSPNIHNYDEIKYIAFKNNYSLKILYINFRSLNEKTEDLIYIINEFKNQNISIDVIALTEHWMDTFKASKFTLTGYNTIFSTRPSKRGGGSAIFIKNNINHNIIKQYNDDMISITTICINNNTEKINICCIYRPNRNIDAVNNFIKLIDDHLPQINNNNNYVIGDFNFDLRKKSNITMTIT